MGKMQGGEKVQLAGNCLHPPIAKTNGLARFLCVIPALLALDGYFGSTLYAIKLTFFL